MAITKFNVVDGLSVGNGTDKPVIDILDIDGNLTTTNANLGNFATANYINVTNQFNGNTGNFTGNIVSLNANLGNLVVANYVTGILTTAVQPNITSVGTLTSLTISDTGNGNIIADNANLGNLATANYVNVTSNITSGNASLGNLVTANYVNVTANLSAGNILTDNILYANGNPWDMQQPSGSNTYIQYNNNNNFGASANFTFDDATNLLTVVGNIQTNNANLGNLASANYVNITANITSGNADLGNLATANYFSGNGSLLTALTFGNITTFSTAGLTTDELYLQSTTRLNVTASGASGYIFDQYGATVNPVLYVTSGQTLAFNLNVAGHPFLIRDSAGANYSTGLEHVDTAGTVLTTASAQGQVAGTLYWKVPYGITGNYKYQCLYHGGMVANIVVTDANVSNILVGSATTATTATTAATVTTNAQPNITSVGTLDNLSVTSNITSGNASLGNLATANYVNVTANITSGNASLGNLASANYFSGNGSLLTGLSADTAKEIANGTSSVTIPALNGNVVVGVSGNAGIVTVTDTGVNVSGYLNVGTGNITSGNANLGNIASANYLTGTLTTAAQPNVTSVGTLTNLTVTGDANAGNFNTSGVLTAGDATITGNLTVNGNTIYANVTSLIVKDPIIEMGGNPNGDPLTSNDGKDRGTLLHYYSGSSAIDAFMGWDNSAGEFAFGSNVNVASEVVTWNSYGNIKTGNASLGNLATANYVNVTANITSGNASLGNLATANYVNVTANITSGNADLGNLLVVHYANVISNITSGNANLGNLATANYFTGNGSLLTGLSADSAKQIANGTSSVTIPSSSGNVVIGVAGNAGVVTVTGTGVNVNGTLNTGTGNITSGNATLGNLASANFVNVTSNLSAGNVLTNNLLYANGTPWDLQLPGGSNTQLQFNDSDSFGGSANLTFDKSTNILTVTGNLQTTNANLGNLATANYFTGNGSQLNLEGFTGNIGTASSNVMLSSSSVSIYSSNGSNNGSMNLFVGNPTNNRSTKIGMQSNLSGTPVISFESNTFSFTDSGNTITGSVITINAIGTTSTTTTNGAMVITGTGGLGVGGNIHAGGNITATNANLGNLTTANYLSGTLVTQSQPNITSVGTLSSLTVTSNISSGNANLGNLTTSNYFAGTLTTSAQPNITSVGTLSSLSVTGNVSSGNANLGNLAIANYFSGDGGYLSNLQISGATVANANYANYAGNAFNVSGSNVTGTVANATYATSAGSADSATTAGTVTTASQPNITSIGTLSSLSVTGNVTSGNANLGNLTISNYFSGNGSLLTSITGGNVTGTVANATYATSAGSATTAGTVTTNAQPNITSVGTLTSVSITGNVTAGNSNLGNLATANYFSGDGSLLTSLTGANVTGTVANATYATSAGSATTAGTVTTNAQPNITSVGTLSSLSVTGNLSSGNANLGNLVTANYFSGDGSLLTSITGANVTGTVANATYATSAGSATTAGTVTTASQPNITSVGTLSSLSVTGNLSSGNANLGNLATANYFSGDGYYLSNINVSNIGIVANANYAAYAGNAFNVTGSNVSGTVANANYAAYAGTVTGSAQSNITSVGTLSSLDVTGNITSNANIVTDLIVGRTSSISITATGTNQNINLTPTGTGKVNVSNFIISNVATPLASTDAATKQYVDDVAQGLHTHDSCQAATPDTLANITSGTITYNNGASGVGANLVTTGSFNLIDGVNVQSSGTRILVKNESNTVHNGIYVWSNATVITRADDFDASSEMAGGDFTFVTAGTLYDNTGWVMPDPVATVGASPVVWVQFSGAGTYTAGVGLSLDGSQFYISNTGVSNGNYGNATHISTFTVNDRGQLTAANTIAVTANATTLLGTSLNSNIISSNLTSLGTLTSLAVTGNITGGNANLGNLATANYFSGDGYYLSNINVGNIGTVANANYSLYAGTVLTNSQPNITSVGTLTSLGVTGNITGGNADLGNLTISNYFSGNGSLLTSITGANVTGTVANANYAAYAGTVLTNAQPNITSVGTLSSLSVTGNITSGNANLGNLATANYIAGTLTTSSQPNITGVGTLSSLGVTGNITAGNVTGANLISANYFQGNGSLLTSITGANVTGTVANATYATSADSATTAGTLTTNAQPNITSVGTLTSLSVTGNISSGNANLGNLATANYFSGNGSLLTGVTASGVTGNANITNLEVSGIANLGSVSNLELSGGSNGQVLTTHGNGDVYFGNLKASIVSTVSNIVSGSDLNISVVYSNATYPAGLFTLSAVGPLTMSMTDSWASGGSSKNAYANFVSNTVNTQNISITLTLGNSTFNIQSSDTLTFGSSVVTGANLIAVGISGTGGTYTIPSGYLTAANTQTNSSVAASTSLTTLRGVKTASGTTLTNIQPIPFNVTALSGTFTDSTVPYWSLNQTFSWNATVSSGATGITGNVTYSNTVHSISGSLTSIGDISGTSASLNSTYTYDISSSDYNGTGAFGAGTRTIPSTVNGTVNPATMYYPLFYKITGSSANPNFTTSDSYNAYDYYTGDGANTTATTTDYLFIATPTSTARTWAFTFLGSQVTVTPDVTYTSQTISGETYTVYGFTNYSAVTQIYST